MIEDLCKKVIIAKNIDDWESQVKACIQDNKNILNLDLLDDIGKTAEDHALTDYAAAIIYHSKKFSNQ